MLISIPKLQNKGWRSGMINSSPTRNSRKGKEFWCMTQDSISFLGSSSQGGLTRSLFTEYIPMEWWNYWIPMARIASKSMDIVSSHSWSHSNQKRRRSTSLSLKKPKQKKGFAGRGLPQSKIFVNFVNFQVVSILLILVFFILNHVFRCVLIVLNDPRWKKFQGN